MVLLPVSKLNYRMIFLESSQMTMQFILQSNPTVLTRDRVLQNRKNAVKYTEAVKSHGSRKEEAVPEPVQPDHLYGLAAVQSSVPDQEIIVRIFLKKLEN